MKPVLSHILALFSAAVMALVPSARAETDIVLAAPETEIHVAPRAAHIRFVNLPAIEFALRAAYRCRGEVVTLTMSVSDTAKTLSRDELVDQRAAEVRLIVPARQVAMADAGAFCVIGDPQSADEMQVAGFATAAASLRCNNDGSESMRYASAPLTVRLRCSRDEDQSMSPGVR